MFKSKKITNMFKKGAFDFSNCDVDIISNSDKKILKDLDQLEKDVKGDLKKCKKK